MVNIEYDLIFLKAEVIEAFLNSVLVCPLPAEALASISEFLGILSSTIYVNAISEQSLGVQPKTDSEDPLDQSCAVEGAGKQVNHKERGIDADLEKSNSEQKASSRSTELSNHHPGTIFSLLSVFETELLRAQKANLIVSPTKIAKDNAERKTSKSTSANRPIIKSEVYEPLLPPSVADNFHEAMHEALVNVMAERDEAHAQLIAANVLHIHQLEQAKRKNERLRIELKVAEELKEVQVQLPNVVQFFGGKFENNAQKERQKALEEKIEGFERILGKNQDDEINALCHQLNGEISAKTSHALEIIRLKETREIERKNELAEKQALKEELRRVKELLAAERRKI